MNENNNKKNFKIHKRLWCGGVVSPRSPISEDLPGLGDVSGGTGPEPVNPSDVLSGRVSLSKGPWEEENFSSPPSLPPPLASGRCLTDPPPPPHRRPPPPPPRPRVRAFPPPPHTHPGGWEGTWWIPGWYGRAGWGWWRAAARVVVRLGCTVSVTCKGLQGISWPVRNHHLSSSRD